MNLEDRLRSHMHSGEDQFVEPATSADDITVAGARRTRRNQIAVGAVAGIAVLSLVFGASSLSRFGDSQQLATDELPGSELMAAEAADPGEIGPAPEGFVPPPFDVIAGIDNDFVGLRNTNGVLTAITSDDGLVWDERATDLPNDLNVSQLIADDGVYVAVVQSLQFGIATSRDLTSWTIVYLEEGTNDVFVNGLALSDDDVVIGATILPAISSDEEDSSFQAPLDVVFRGPLEGPYERVEVASLTGGILGVASADENVAIAPLDDSSAVAMSNDSGQTWFESTPSSSLTVGLTSADDKIIWFGSPGGVRDAVPPLEARASKDGESWESITLPEAVANAGWWSFNAKTTGDTAVVVLDGPDGDRSKRSVIVSTGGDFIELDLTAHMTTEQIENSMLVATSDEEAVFEFFGTPSDDPTLASSSGVADGDNNGESAASGPSYISVPLK